MKLNPNFLLALIILVAPLTQAADFHSARTASLGGAGHGGPLLNDAIHMNPAFTSYLKNHYAVAFNFGKYSGPTHDNIVDNYYGNIMNISLQDGRSEMFQAGVSYTRRQDARFFHIGASKQIIDRLSVGIGSKIYFRNDEFKLQGRDFTFAASGIVTEWFQASFIVDNLNESSSERDAHALYREFILGTRFQYDRIYFFLDPHIAPSAANKFGYELGVEVTAMHDLFIRFGYSRHSNQPVLAIRGDKAFALGAGITMERITIDYSYSRFIEPYRANAHTVGLTAFF